MRAGEKTDQGIREGEKTDLSAIGLCCLKLYCHAAVSTPHRSHLYASFGVIVGVSVEKVAAMLHPARA
jgi:hypothetical protein